MNSFEIFVNSFDDPRSRQSEESALSAERALSQGDVAASERLFAEAAELEEAVARDVPAEEARVRAVLAASALALWLKAGRPDQALRVGEAFMVPFSSSIFQVLAGSGRV